MIVRLWTSTSPTTGLPFSTSIPSWHQLCDCGHLDHLPSDTRGPRGLLADSDEPIPADVLQLAAKATHRCRKPAPVAVAPEPEPVATTEPRGGWTRHQWTPEQDAIVAASTCEAAADKLGVSSGVVGWRRRWLRKQGLMPAARVSRPWTAEEDAVILSLPTCEAARKLGRNQSSVSTRKSMLLAKGVAA